MSEAVTADRLIEVNLQAIEGSAISGLTVWRNGFVAINPDPSAERAWRISRVKLHIEAAKGYIRDLEELLASEKP